MKYKIGILLSLVTLLIMLAMFLGFFKKEGFVRVEILPGTEEFLKQSPSQQFTIKTQGSTIIVGNKEGKSTFQGTAVPRDNANQEAQSLAISPRLNGKYIAEFSLLLEPGAGRELRAYVRQLRSGEIKRIRCSLLYF